MKRKCVICDREFYSRTNAKFCPDCSPRRRKTTVELGGLMKCARCGREIERTVATKRYCAACHEFIRRHHGQKK